MNYPKQIFSWISDREARPASGEKFPKLTPATGEVLGWVAAGGEKDAAKAVASAVAAFPAWSATPVVKGSEILREAALLMKSRAEELAEIVALESGKSKKDARGEVAAAVECGLFFAGEGRRFSGEILPSANPNRRVELRRMPAGVGALVTPFNNPAAGIAWKLFPALLCGNAVIIKSHELTPFTAIWFAKVFKEAGLPSGVLSVLQGSGREVGAPLVKDPAVRFVSFTGSVKTGQFILRATADRLAKVSIESGGKNPFVVCDDADLEKAATVAAQAAFVDAGQRCVAASRIIVFASVYERFKKLFLQKVKALRVGTADTDDYGAIISEDRMKAILRAVAGAVKRRAVVLAGGHRLTDAAHAKGFFIAPTVLERVKPDDPISQEELFGPVLCLYKAKDFKEALALANNSKFKLSGAIHTRDMSSAEPIIRGYESGVARVNGPTHGSEPHMPFGGVGLSGNGWREPGRQALDFYAEWKQISIDY